MGAAKLDLNAEQGATFSRSCTLKDSAGDTVDLTGWSIAGKIRSQYDSGTVAATFTVTIANQGTNQGEFSFSLSASTTAGMSVDASSGNNRKPTTYLYDIEATKPDTTVDRILEGKFFLSPEVTK